MKSLIQIFKEASEVKDLGVSFKDLKKEEFFLYQDLYKKAKLVAGGLIEKGIKTGDKIAIIQPTGSEFYLSFFGVLLAGATPSALYPPVRLGKLNEWKNLIKKQIEKLNAKLVISKKALSPIITDLLSESSKKISICSTKELEKSNISYEFQDVSAEDLAFIQFSSGSTSDPKPVMISNRALFHNATSILEKIPNNLPKPDSIRGCISWLPLYHDMGLVGALICSMMDKSPITLIKPEVFVTKPYIWLKTLSETKYTVSVAPNFAFGLCTKKIPNDKLSNLDLSHWQVALCGAETVHPNTLKDFANKFKAVNFKEEALTPVYGMSEITLAATFSEINKKAEYISFDQEKLENEKIVIQTETAKKLIKLPSLGKPLSGISLQVMDNKKNDLGEKMVGNIYLKGKSLMSGYFQIKEQDSNEWFNTGDTGFLYKEELFLCGRSKDLIIVRGRNIDPSQLEFPLNGINEVRKGCGVAISKKHEENDTEIIYIFAELSNDKLFDNLNDELGTKIKNTIKNQIRNKSGITPDIITLLSPGTLPRTSSGKIRRQSTLKLWEENKLLPPKKIKSSFHASLLFSENIIKSYLKNKFKL